MSALTYEEALRALQERGRFGIRLGLGRTRALLRELGDPQLEFRGALVAGTNGKGSVLALAGAALRAAGVRVAETPKPHLISYRERLQVDGRLVDPTTFARLVGEVLEAADRVGRRSLGQPTEFELLTAVAFRWFAEMRVDLALVEVGLGGRLDATHAWDGGVAAITNVDLDHTDRLGPTVTAIAREKAAIIERGDLAVTGATGDALQIVRRRAHRLGVPLTEVAPPPVTGWDRDGITVALPRLGETRIGLRGRHQAANAAVADAVLDALETAGIATVPDDARRRGYAEARWPGRLELIETSAGRSPGGNRQVLLDGAHNPAGAAVLARALDDLRPTLQGGDEADPPPITLLLATMADKDVAGVLAALAASPIARAARVVCTEVDHPRSLSAASLAKGWAAVAPGSGPVAVRPVAAALEQALSDARGPVVVAGSLYLVGAVRAILVDDPELRDDAAHGVAPRAVGPEALAAVR
ncbi:MAG: Mur ligase family protein [Chloroflexota bacterium]|nr:Mur ligase family protein [Chloroflexota bacterium]